MKSSKIVAFVLFFLIVSVGIFIFFSDYLGMILPLTIVDRTNIFLSVVIALFALMEGYSTYLQVELSQNKNLIDDARNELEKAYGPLYTILNQNLLIINQKLLEESPEKRQIDEIMATYPFMFPKEIFKFWRNHIQYLHKYYTKKADAQTIADCQSKISEFMVSINKEYEKRLQRYNKLLNK